MFENLRMRESCGKLIKYYREQNYKDTTSQELLCCNFILATQKYHFFEIAAGQPVCSKATLNRLERGQSTKDDDLYSFFIKKLGYEAHDDIQLTEKLEMIYPRFFKAIDLYIIEDIEKLEVEIEELFKNKNNWFYYREIYTAMKIIFDYYLRASYPIIEDADRLLETHFILDSGLDELLLTVLFEFYYNIKLNISTGERIVEMLLKRKNTMHSKISISYWWNYKKRFLDAFECIEKALIYYKDKSDFRMSLFYFAKANAIHTINRSEDFGCYDLAMEYLEKIDGTLAEDKKVKNYFNIGYHYYSAKKYEKAFNYFSKFLLCPRVFSAHFLYILSCAELCGVSDLKEKFSNVLPIPHNDKSINIFFYHYFTMKINNDDVNKLEKCIMTEIYKALKLTFYSDDIFEYFKSELSELVRTTKRYKDLGIFEGLASHNTD